MKTLLNKRDARFVLNVLDWAKDEVKRANLYVEAQWEHSRIRLVDDKYVYQHCQVEFPIEVKETKTYFDEETNKDEISKITGEITADYCFINDEKVTIQECRDAISDDIKDEIGYLNTIDLTPLENYLSKLCKMPVKFEKTLGEREIRLKSNNLIEQAGICKLMLKDLHMITTLCLNIDGKTGEQEVYVYPINFDYNHTNGGRNGYEALRVKYDMKNGWYFYSREIDEYVRM